MIAFSFAHYVRLRSSHPLLVSATSFSNFPGNSYGQMESILLQIPGVLKATSFRGPDASKIAVIKRPYGHSTSLKAPRRLFLQFIGFNVVSLKVCPLLAAQTLEMKEPDVIRSLFGFEAFRTQKLVSGVRIQDVVEGEGPEAHEGDIVEFNYVCRRSNGYFVHSTVDQFSGESSPVLLPLDDKQIIEGLKEVLLGMKVGGKRRALIPPSVGFVNENLQPIPDEFGPRRSLLSHVNEPLIFEVQLLKVL